MQWVSVITVMIQFKWHTVGHQEVDLLFTCLKFHDEIADIKKHVGTFTDWSKNSHNAAEVRKGKNRSSFESAAALTNETILKKISSKLQSGMVFVLLLSCETRSQLRAEQ